jgi:hypothetical protein
MYSRPQSFDSARGGRFLGWHLVATEVVHEGDVAWASTSIGAVRQIWRQRAAEFQSFDVQVAVLACLLAALSGMSVSEPLVQEILRAGPHTANVFHQGAHCQIVGAVPYGKPGHALPNAPAMPLAHRGPRRRVRTAVGQLDLFM